MSLRKKQRIALAGVILSENLSDSEDEYEPERRKRIWIKEWIKMRKNKSHTTLLRELQLTSPLDFQNYLRMDSIVYEELLQLVTPHIRKEDTQMRDAITPHERLVATLRFLATGQSYTDMMYRSYIGKSTLSLAIMETCKAIIKVLKDYIHLPKTEDEWKGIAEEFEVMWNFPHCLGAIDGKHINIIKPKEAGSYYFNYLKTHSIVLMATANAKCEFINCEVGANGRVSDGGVYGNSKLCALYQRGELNIPKPKKVSGFHDPLPYVFVADAAFPLGVNMMKPYSARNLSADEEHFNYRLSRARRVVENTFGIASSRFRILLTTMHLNPKKATIIVLAICYLHNFLKKKCSNAYLQYITPSDNVESSEMIDLEPIRNRNPSVEAKLTRDSFRNYFKEPSH